MASNRFCSTSLLSAAYKFYHSDFVSSAAHRLLISSQSSSRFTGTWKNMKTRNKKKRKRKSYLYTGGKLSNGFGKSSLKHSKNFRIISSKQKLVRALTSTPKAIPRTNTSCCLATFGTKTAGSVTSRKSDVAINGHLFPRLYMQIKSTQIHQKSENEESCYLFSGIHVPKSRFTLLEFTFANDHTEGNSILFTELKLV